MKKHFITFYFVLWAITFVVLAATVNKTIASVVFILLAIASTFIAWFFEFGNVRD